MRIRNGKTIHLGLRAGHRLALAVMFPVAACGSQWFFWDVLRPYAWFLFFPAMFFSSWIGGRRGGLLATLISILLVDYFFLPPQFSFAIANPSSLISMAMFAGMGALFSHVHERLRRANQLAADAQFREVFKQAAVGMAQVRLDGSFQDLNHRFCDIVGYSREELQANAFQNITHPDDLAADLACVRKLLTGEINSYSLEKRYLRKDRSVVTVNLTVTLVRDPTGKPDYFISVVEDIEERKRNSAAVARLAAVVQFSDDAIISKSPEGIVTSWNAGAEKLFGYRSDEMIGQPLTRIIPTERQHEEVEILARINRGEKVQHFETVRRCKDGRALDVSVTVSPIRDATGKVVGASKVARDITQRKQAEAALRKSQDQLNFALKTSHIGAWDLNLLDHKSSRTEIHAQIFGYNTPLPDWSYEKFLEHVLPEDRAQVDLGFREAGAGPGDRTFECRIRRVDGEIRWIYVAGGYEQNDDGQPVRMSGIVQDITERKLDEQRVRESEYKFSQMFNSSPVATTLSTCAEGRYLDVNGAWLKLFEWSRTEVIGHTVFELNMWVDLKQREKLIASFERDEVVHDLEMTLRAKSGRVVQISWSGAQTFIGGERCLLGSALDVTERRRAEQALRASEERLRFVTDNAHVGLVMVNHEHRYIFANSAYVDMLDLPSAEIIGLRVADVLPEIYEQQIRPRLDRAFAGERVIYELHKPRRGSDHFYAVTYEPNKMEGSEQQSVVVVITDVTERKQWGLALQKSEQFKQAILDSVPANIAVLDRQGTIQAVNARWHQFALANLPGNRGQVVRCGVGADYLAACEPCDRDARSAREGILAVLAGRQESFSFEYRCDAPTTNRWFTMTATPMNPERDAVVIAHTDISERRQRDEEIRWKTAFLEALVYSSVDGLLVVDDTGKKIFQNQKLLDFWKIPPEIAANPDDHFQYQFALDQTTNPAAFAKKTRLINLQPDVLVQDEVELKCGRVLERQSYQVKDPGGTRYGRVWIFRDITKSRQMETQLRQSQKMEAIGQLAGGIAHDFNNILAAMFGHGYLLLQDTAGNEAAQEGVTEILKAAERAKDLVQQILTFSRQREHKRQVIGLDIVVKEAMKFLRASLPAEIKIEVNVAKDAPAVLADPTQIYQVVMNLATNALHAMEGRTGTLTVALEAFEPDERFIGAHPEFQARAYARLAVADTGHGMDAKTLEHIFEPFFTTKPIGKGTGLGLAVVHGIMQTHEGLVIVKSQIGQGTTFNLYFPAQTNGEIVSEANNHGKAICGKGQSILLLDDEPALTRSLQRLLEKLNYRVTSRNNPREAIKLFCEKPAEFDLVITDMSMPEITGLEVARQIHAARANIPVILISGYSPKFNRDHLQTSDIDELLEKPLSVPALGEALHRLLSKA
jgi:PAS domain S-box-containing protein